MFAFHKRREGFIHLACLILYFLVERFSAYSATVSIAFWVAAAAGTLYGSGMLQVIYCTSMPLFAVGVPDLIDVWIGNLPSQVI